MRKSTIAVSFETLKELESLKKDLKMKSYDELLKLLTSELKKRRMERAWKLMKLDEETAKKIEKIIEKRRESWWRRSY